MAGRIVPSEFVELGDVDLSWREDTFPRNALINATFETASGADELSRVAKLTGKISVIRGLLFLPVPVRSRPPNLPDGLRNFVDQIDRPYREYREIDEGTILRHAVTCVVGKARGSILHRTVGAGLPPITPPGGAHFDRLDGADDIVIASHGGVPTRVFTGPVRKFSDHPITDILPIHRPFAAHPVITPEDTAIMMDENTLHQTAPQFFSNKNPSMFFRSFIETVNQ